MPSPCILYLNTAPGDRIQEMTLAGIRRYAGARGWAAEAVPKRWFGPRRLAALLAARRPVAGCVVDCSDDGTCFSPSLFGAVPVVYLHPPPELRDGRVAYVATDNEAIARAAFRELSAGRPAAYATIGVSADYSWSRIRLETFRALCASEGLDCRVLSGPERGGWTNSNTLLSWVAALPRHTAIFAVNDFAATNIVRAARAAHLSIPRDLTLLAVDNNEAICEASDPPLSSIQIDFERAGFLAARMLASQMKARALYGKTNAADAANDKITSLLPTAARHCAISARHCGEAAPSLQRADESVTASVGPLLAVRRKSTSGRGRHEPRILEAVEMIRREACDGLTAAKLASRFDCSRWLFEMRFREATGYSVLEEILHVRMEKALTLLSQTDTAIGAIYTHCGFRSGRALDSLFHARFKTSMREWRKRNGCIRR